MAMYNQKRVFAASALILITLALAAPAANAGKPSEYDAIVSHLKTKYQAKKVKIPFMWLARFAVGFVRPAGVKSFSVTLFDHLKVARETLDAEMQNALRQTFSSEWSPVFRVRSRTGQQAYMYMREDGENVRVTLVTIEKDQAAIIRATFSPEKLVEFTNDPKIFGVHLDDDKKADAPKTNDEPTPRAKPAQ
jgi:hypothetical protein